jgi:glycosyltransferase involved in cell wall biosynthesis
MDASVTTKKILLVTNIPNPYRLPLFNELDRLLKQEGMELVVVFGATGYHRRRFTLDWSEATFPYEMLDSSTFQLGNIEKTAVTYRKLSKTIRNHKPDAIIVSGFSMATLKIWLHSFFSKRPYVIWSGSVEFPGWFDSGIRKLMRHFFVRRASAYIAYGTKAKEYFERRGASSKKISIAINTVDVGYFAKETQSLRSSVDKSGLRHLLYVGYLEPRKNVANLIVVVEKLSRHRKDFVLDIAGDGSQKNELEQLVRAKGLEHFVRFHGFLQKKELPELFALADCFLFQTDFDIWGLVLNEAMAAGIPCIAPSNAGATADLISDGETGFVADFLNHDALISIINRILDDHQLANKIGIAAVAFIRDHVNLAVSAQGFMSAIQSIVNQKSAS